MDPIKITQAEAERLIRTLKYSLEEQIEFLIKFNVVKRPEIKFSA